MSAFSNIICNIQKKEKPPYSKPELLTQTVVRNSEGRPHNICGPAVTFSNGNLMWFIDGVFLDSYRKSSRCYTPLSYKDGLDRINSKIRPYSYDYYLSDLKKMFTEGDIENV